MAGTENRELIAQAEALEFAINVMRERLEFGESYKVIDSRAKMLRAQAVAQPPAAQPVPAYYVYEWDTAFGVHTDTSAAPWNGMPPDRTVLLYRQPDPRIAQLKADLSAAQAEAVALRKIVNGDVAHIYLGQCPDEDDWSARDPDCHACQILGPYVATINAAKESGNV